MLLGQDCGPSEFHCLRAETRQCCEVSGEALAILQQVFCRQTGVDTVPG
jgi:hypothetical protein